jgi:hypothetical protein
MVWDPPTDIPSSKINKNVVRKNYGQGSKNNNVNKNNKDMKDK